MCWARQYLKCAWSRIPLRYDERTRTLTIGTREGTGYAGMPGTRTINVRWTKPGVARPLAFDAKADATITYTGRPLTLRMR